MKIRYLIISLLVFALVISVNASFADPAGAAGKTDTTEPWYYAQPTVAENAYLGDDGIVVGPFTFRHTTVSLSDYEIFVGYKTVAGLTLYSYDGDEENVVIPSEVGGIPVVAIGGSHSYDANYYQVFTNNTTIKTVVIPDSVRYIGPQAFYGCTNLTDVTMPSELDSIGKEAFYGCSSLTNLSLPSCIAYIRDGAFYGCTNLTIQALPAELEDLGDQVFSGCNMEQITLLKDAYYDDHAFCDITTLKKAVIQDGLQFVPCFENCVNLTEVVLPEGVTVIGSFSGCTSLKNLMLPSSIVHLGSTDSLSDTVEFLAGTKVTFLDIPDGVYYFDDRLFANCSLESLVVPTSVRSFGEEIFDNTPLERIYFRGTEEECSQALLDQAAEVNATVYYYSETRPTEKGNYWRYVNGKPSAWLWTWG